MQMLKQWMAWISQYPEIKYGLQILALVLAAWVTRRFVIAWLSAWTKRTKNQLDDSLVLIFQRAVNPLMVLAVMAASLNLFPVPPKLMAVLNRVVYLLVLLTVLWFTSKAVQMVVDYWLRKKQGDGSLGDPARFVTRVLFAAIAVMMLLDNLGVSLTALWTTLGVGSIAIALALQETLSNFFAGIYLRLDRPVRVGDFVKLETNQQGLVVNLGWRSTHIRTDQNNVVVVPNAKLATSTLTNFSLPSRDMSLLLPVIVSDQEDPEHVEQILMDEATRAASEIEGVLSQPAPYVRFIPTFTDESLHFTLICQVSKFADRDVVQHELGKRIFMRLRREEVALPKRRRAVLHAPKNDGHDLALRKTADSSAEKRSN